MSSPENKSAVYEDLGAGNKSLFSSINWGFYSDLKKIRG